MADEMFAGGGAGETTADRDDRSPFRSIDEIPAAGGPTASGSAAADEPHRLDLVLNIPVRLSVELGRAEIPIREVVNVGRGSVIELDRALGEPLDVRVNGVLIGHGEIVVCDEERLGLRLVDVVSQAERVNRLT
jgi:flagellar motor switch protein FliN